MQVEKFFSGKNVIITGGATGIGKALAVQLTEIGANLLLIGRRESLLKEIQGELVGRRLLPNQQISVLACDISDRPLLEKCLSERLKAFNVDVLINNAGIPCADYFTNVSADEFERVININFIGSVTTTRIVLPHLLKKRCGQIAFVSSLAGKVGIVGYTAYAASKFAQAGFAEALRNELVSQGITVSILFPPDVQTPLLDSEDRTKPSETRALNTGKALSAEMVSRVFLKQIARGTFEVVPGIHAKCLAFLLRHFPRLVIWFNDWTVGRVRRFSS